MPTGEQPIFSHTPEKAAEEDACTRIAIRVIEDWFPELPGFDVEDCAREIAYSIGIWRQTRDWEEDSDMKRLRWNGSGGIC